MSFFLHEVRYKRDSKHLFFQLLSILFSVLVRILKLFSSHHLCITLCRIQKYKFYWCKTTTAWVIGIGPQFSCTWPQCASSLQLILASFATTCQQLIAISVNSHVRTINCDLCLPPRSLGSLRPLGQLEKGGYLIWTFKNKICLSCFILKLLYKIIILPFFGFSNFFQENIAFWRFLKKT